MPVPYDPENINLSKEQFIEKRRKQKELAAKLDVYKQQAMAEIEAESPTPEVKHRKRQAK